MLFFFLNVHSDQGLQNSGNGLNILLNLTGSCSSRGKNLQSEVFQKTKPINNAVGFCCFTIDLPDHFFQNIAFFFADFAKIGRGLNKRQIRTETC